MPSAGTFWVPTLFRAVKILPRHWTKYSVYVARGMISTNPHVCISRRSKTTYFVILFLVDYWHMICVDLQQKCLNKWVIKWPLGTPSTPAPHSPQLEPYTLMPSGEYIKTYWEQRTAKISTSGIYSVSMLPAARFRQCSIIIIKMYIIVFIINS